MSQGHCFSLGTYERELIYSFDVCSGCESHAIMRQLQEAYFQLKEGHVNDLQSWIASQMGQVVSISNWKSQGRNDIDFQYCPIKRKES